MGTEVRLNMYFSRYHDPNEKASHKNMSLSYENSIMKNTQNWNGLPRRSSIHSPSGSEKEQMRQTIVKQETIFRHQLNELHRLYRIQRNLMKEAKSTPQSSFLSSSCIASQQETNRWPNYNSCSNRRGVHASEKNVPESTSEILKQKQYLLEPKIQRQLFDLERPVHEFINGEEDRSNLCLKGFPLKGEFKKPDFFANPQITADNVAKGKAGSNTFFSQSSSFEILSSSSQVTFNKLLESTASLQPMTDRRIFGVEIPDRNHGDSSTIMHWNNGSSGLNITTPKNEESMRWQNGNLVSLSSYQMSTDSLQKNFHQFVQDSSSSTRDSKKMKSDGKNRLGLGDIGGYDHNLAANSSKSGEIKAEEVASGPRNLFDLNVCLAEEEQEDAALIHCPEKSTEIDLEVPITEAEESESDKSAAETLIVLSKSKTDQHSSDVSLYWFADLLSSLDIEIDSVDIENESFAPAGMDYFEFVTLNLTESTESQPEEHRYKHKYGNVSSSPQKGTTRRGGRHRKDFQRDVLPGLTSLSRNEVTKDLHAIEGMIKAAKCPSKGFKSRNKRQCTSKCRDEGTLTLMQWGKRGRRPKRTRCSSAFQPVSLKEVF